MVSLIVWGKFALGESLKAAGRFYPKQFRCGIISCSEVADYDFYIQWLTSNRSLTTLAACSILFKEHLSPVLVLRKRGGMMTQAPNWREVETILFEQGKMAIERFATEHPDLMCSFFAIFADPLSGEFAFCFDTPQNAFHQAMKQELYFIGDRQSRSKRSESWRYAGSLSASLLEYPSSTERFHFFSYTLVSFHWLEFTDSEAYPEHQEGQEDYLEGYTRLIIWRALERLIADKTFLHLSMTAPFRIGYQFSEESLIVLRFLNWPDGKGNFVYSVIDSPLAHEKLNKER